ncbi:MAG: hypothetical protein LBE91_20455, partial [Tannerella sp.]|nr:hypothetical protein [Tannerella sp.]
MKDKLLILLILFTFLPLHAQQNRDWKTYLAYNSATQVEETNNQVFVLADGALYSYGIDDSEIVLYSKQNGLNDTDIGIIKYSTDNN